MRRSCLLAAVCLLLSCQNVQSQRSLLDLAEADTSQYFTEATIVWGDIPDAADRPAQLVTENTDIGQCVCDLTYQACDANCGCDADCAQSYRNNWNSADAKDEGPVALETNMCIDSDELSVNTRGELHVSVADNLLCIQRWNSASKGDFFDDYGTIDDTLFGQSRFNFPKTLNSPTTGASSSSSYYLPGATVNAQVDDGAGAQIKSSGMRFQAPGFSGLCNPNSFVTFLEPQSSRCFISVAATECESAFDVRPWAERLGVAPTPASASGSFLSLTASTGNIYNQCTDEACVTTPFASTTNSGPAPSYALPTCSNALRKVEYNITYDAGEITGVSTNVYFLDLAEDTSSGSAMLNRWIDFSVEWTDASASLAPIQRSGSPGYMFGKPVLSGFQIEDSTTSKQAIIQRKQGLLVVGPDTDGACSTSDLYASQVLFGKNMMSGCGVSLNLAALQAFCEATPASLAATGSGDMTGYPYLFVADQYDSVTGAAANPKLGKWGNSMFSNVEDWLSLSIATSLSTQSPSWASTTQTCANMVTGMTVEILWANYGAKLNPQAQIVRARVQFQTGNWQFTLPSATDAQTFQVQTSVTFEEMDSDQVSPYVPPVPDLIPGLPYDVLYPLSIGD